LRIEREEAGHRATPSRKKRERADSPTSNPNSTYPRLNKKNREKNNIHKNYPQIHKKWIKCLHKNVEKMIQKP
jgi:hypothetical protein